MKKYNKRYREKNKEKINLKQKEWRDWHKDVIIEYNKEYRDKNRTTLIEKRKTYVEKNKEYIRQWQKRYRDDNKNILNMYWKQYRELHKEELSMKHKLRNSEKWYVSIHNKTDSLIRKLWIRPIICSVCWWKWKIEAHHQDYNKWNEVVFCCQSCHKLIHNWYINNFKTVNILNFNK